MNLIKSIKSFRYAINGLRLVLKENNFRIHLLAVAAVAGAGTYFNLSRSEWLWLLSAICIVVVAECMNTAIEKLTDLVSPGYNKQAGEVKDLAAGAVLLSSVFAVITGGIIFIPKVADLIR
jgi:diacylglycerol kinase